MITTRNVNVNLDKGKLKLRHITTKNIDAGIRVEPPKQPIKTKSITSTTLPDVADIAEKKRRDDIAAEKKIVIAEKKMKVEKELTEEERYTEMKKQARREGVELDESPRELVTELKETTKKKPWKEMTGDEKKVAIKERTAKMMVTKARKKRKMKIDVETTARYADDKGEPQMAIVEPMKKGKKK